jgi:hypothetical protein
MTDSLHCSRRTPRQPQAWLSTCWLAAAGSLPAQTDLAQPNAAAPFVANAGQWPAAVGYSVRGDGSMAWFTNAGWVVATERFDTETSQQGTALRGASRGGVAINMRFEGSSAEPVGVGMHSAPYHFITGGHNTVATHTCRGHAALRYASLYPGIDAVVRVGTGLFAYDLHLAAGAMLEQIVLRVDGGDRLHLDSDGRLVIENAVSTLRWTKPRAWYVLPDGSHEAVACSFLILDAARHGFALQAPRRPLPLVIDPGIEWMTAVGGSAHDWAHSGTRDPATGASYATGEIYSADFPTTFGHGFAGGSEVALVKTSATGQVVWTVVMRGSAMDYGSAVAVGPTGEVAIAGLTRSGDFPTTPGAYDTTLGSIADGFVALVDAHGTLRWSTLLGGSSVDLANCIAFDAIGRVVVGGTTNSIDFPTTPGVVQRSLAGDYDLFVAKFDPVQTGASQLVFGTYLGGRLTEAFVGNLFVNTFDSDAMAILVDAGGETVVAGMTQSLDFPTTANAFQRTHTGGQFSDVALVVLNPTATTLIYGTYIGGLHQDFVRALAPHPGGGFVYAGATFDSSYPTTPNAYSRTIAGRNDGVVCWFDPSRPGAAGVRYATLIGGGPPGSMATAADGLWAVAVDPSGIVTAGGFSNSTTFPTTAGAYATVKPGPSSCGVLCRFAMLGQGRDDLLYASYLGGGSPGTGVLGLGLDAYGGAVATLASSDPTFTSSGTVDFVTLSLDLLPQGIARGPGATAPCGMPLFSGVRQAPMLATSNFGITFSAGPPATAGAAAIGTPLSTPIPVLGADLALTPLLTVPIQTDGLGFAQLPLPISSNVAVGAAASVQAVFLTTLTCPGTGPLASSNRIDVTVF